jgi:HlyD family secretion protein
MTRALFLATAVVWIALGSNAQGQQARAPATKPAEPRPIDLVNEVEGRTMILELVPAGTHVRKGEVVCRLDSAALRDRLLAQEIQVQRRLAEVKVAAATREAAEGALDEYREGTYPQQRTTAEGEVRLAENEAERTGDDLKRARESKVDREILRRAEVAAERAEVTLRTARGRLRTLTDATMPRVVRGLAAEIEKARAEEAAAQAAYRLEVAQRDKLKQQVEKCAIIAPRDGRVIAPKPTNPEGEPIAEGSVVRERQVVARLVPEAD